MLKLLICYTERTAVHKLMVINTFIFDDLDFLISNKKTGLKNPVSKLWKERINLS